MNFTYNNIIMIIKAPTPMLRELNKCPGVLTLFSETRMVSSVTL